ncbi:MAG: DEAD/DEAH box helicase [Gemmatimonadales bacterium]|nr:DEAD/DEAH box helicase [Gemmatimonadales bacterium]
MPEPLPFFRLAGRSSSPWPDWLANAPRLVAESLIQTREPLASWLRPGPVAPAEEVAAALAAAMLPAEAEDDPPAWLRSDQRLSFRRALAAIRRFDGAILADPVGSGKTFIALAVAAALAPGRIISVLAPAVVLPQWREAASLVGLPICAHSHETVSRGRLPAERRGPVIVDESHRFRNPATQRYRMLAPWCTGRRGLLLTATPAVNHLSDLAHQLLLFVRHSALAANGLASLRSDELDGHTAALAHLIVTGEDRAAKVPARRTVEIRADESASSPFAALQEAIASLTFSSDAGIAALARMSFLQALGSSPPALQEMIARYRALLLHAREARAAGCSPSRQAIRGAVGPCDEQLVFWALIGDGGSFSDLAVQDLAALDSCGILLRRWTDAPNAKLTALRRLLADDRPTLIFTTATATVRHIRDRLDRRGVAWCTGSAAGLDGGRLSRERVLDWFRTKPLPTDLVHHRPTVLVATDVASEGLDLPRVERVVHYDLPWTATRLEQRSGRALRLGSRHREVEIVRFRLPALLEEQIRKEAAVETKGGLPRVLGLTPEVNAPWRFRADLSEAWAEVRRTEGVASLAGEVSAAVAGFRITTSDGTTVATVLAKTPAGWSDAPEVVAEVLAVARGARGAAPPSRQRVRELLRALAAPARTALRSVSGGAIESTARTPAVRQTIRRILRLAGLAARARDRQRLELLGRGLAFLKRGHTAGEEWEIVRWCGLSDRELPRALTGLPPEGPPAPIERISLIGILVVEPREWFG